MAEDESQFRFVPPPDPNIGRRVDRYFILRKELGRGGMGAAYLAEHEARAHIRCVVKLVLPEIARHPMIISRYNTEVEALSLLKHENIPKLDTFGVLDDGQLYMRLEFVEGKSLDLYLKEHGGTIPLRKAAYFIFQLCGALQYAHQRGVIHRDLKPDNLIIEVKPPGSHLEERVNVLDFGIAKVVGSSVDATGSGVTMGTATHMAPEQVTNAAAVNDKADVFSVAVIFYQMLTGTLPWGVLASDMMIYHAQRTQAPILPPEHLMPGAVAKVVMRCLSLNPEDRPTMHELAIELACAILAEDDQESGVEILAKVVPTWVSSSPPDAQTLPRPVVPDPDAVSPSLVGSPSREAHMPESVLPARQATPESVQPPSVAASRASAAGTSGESSDVSTMNLRPAQQYAALEAGVVAPRVWSPPPTPVIAALPTGLVSQRFGAQPAPLEERASPPAIAAEIVLAAGTPAGPRPYAHRELPPVVVSTTQLIAGTPLPSKPSVPEPAQREPLPALMLPVASHAKRRRWLVVTLAAAIVTTASYAVIGMRRGSHVSPSDGRAGSASVEQSVALAPVDAGAVASESSPGAAASSRATVDTTTPSSVAKAAVTPASATRLGEETTEHIPQPIDAGTSTPSGPSFRTAGSSPVVPAKPRAPTPAAQGSVAAPPSKVEGELVISVRPWAAIWLNGRSIPDGTPYRAQLPAGRYRLRLANDDVGQNEVFMVTVEPHKTTTVERKW